MNVVVEDLAKEYVSLQGSHLELLHCIYSEKKLNTSLLSYFNTIDKMPLATRREEGSV